MLRPAAGLAVPAAAAALFLAADHAAAVAWIGPFGVAAALGAMWLAGTFGRRRWRERIVAALLVACLAMGGLAAAGRIDAAGPLGLPVAVWGLLGGVWILPLVLTSASFAVFFRPPDAAALKRAQEREPTG